jgi:hypothetical protein
MLAVSRPQARGAPAHCPDPRRYEACAFLRVASHFEGICGCALASQSWPSAKGFASNCYARQNHSHIVTPSRRLDVCIDPDDSMFLECADAARGDYLIGGNQRHFPRLWKKTKIITTRGVYQLGCASFNKVAKFRRLCINVELTS